MFVVEAVVLTFITTPITLLIYPEKHRVRGSEIDRKSPMDAEKSIAGRSFAPNASGGREQTSRFLVVLQKIEHLAAVMLLAQMLEPPAAKQRSPPVALITSKNMESDVSDESTKSSPSHTNTALPTLSNDGYPVGPVRIDALKLIELTGRTFSVMQSAEKDQLLLTDDALQLFRQFGRLRGLDITPHISIVGEDSFPAAVAEHADVLSSQLVILPWTVPVTGNASLIEPPMSSTEPAGLVASTSRTPFDNLFGAETQGSPMYSHFLRRVFTECPSDIALFIDRGFGSSGSFAPGAGQHVFLPFFGGLDDRLALRFVIQLCHHQNVTATIVRISKPDTDAVVTGKMEMSESMQLHQNALHSNQLTIGASSSVS